MRSIPGLTDIERSINEGDYVTARRLLATFIRKDPNNPRLLWMLAQTCENQGERYQVLNRLIQLPTNPYTGQARGAISRMAYQPTPTKSRLLSKPAIWLLSIVALVIIVALAALLLTNRGGQVAQANTVKAANQAANQSNKVAVAQSQPVQQVQVVQPESRPTENIPPTWTPEPTAIPHVAQSVPMVAANDTQGATQETVAATTADQITDQIKEDPLVVLQSLDRVLNDHTSSFNQMAQTTMKEIEDMPDWEWNSSAGNDMRETVKDQVNHLLRLRNEVMGLKTKSISTELRTDAVLPATRAYIVYSNSVLQWIDLKTNNITNDAVDNALPQDTTLTINKPVVNTTNDSDRQKLISLQAAAISTNEKALQKALIDLRIATTLEGVKAAASSLAITATSNNPSSIALKAGSYTFSCKLAAENTSTPKFWLVSASAPNTKVQLNQNATKGCSGSNIQISGGAYYLQSDSTTWWVSVLEPQVK